MGSTSRQSLPDGSSFGTDRFVIERQLGEGSMGAVYLAYDNDRRVRVALKTLRRVDASGIYRFKREFRALADVSHPNLVSLHELFSEGADWFFTMEYVEGQDFLGYVCGEPALANDFSPHRTREMRNVHRPRARGMEVLFPSPVKDPERLRAVLRQVTEGVMALHAKEKLHRDLKSDHVMVTPEGRAVVLDFGIAFDRAQDQHGTLEAGVFGTPAYMSPEQSAGKAVSEATDWYSLGVMLYEALTGHVPFDGPYMQVIREKQATDPPRPSELVADVPEDLDELAMALLSREPGARPTGEAILAALGAAAGKEGKSAGRGRDSRPPLLGRREELDELERALRATDEGAPVLTLVHGLTGMGKSRLVETFLQGLARDQETVVVGGRCYEHEVVPFKALDSVVDSLSRYLGTLAGEEAGEVLPTDVHALGQVFPVLKRVAIVRNARRRSALPRDPKELRRRAAGALREMLFRIANRQPLVVYIDDLQWGDVDSARMLADLLRGPDRPAMLLVCTYREEDAERSPCLRTLFDLVKNQPETRTRQVRVRELDDEESLALARDLLGPSAAHNAQAVAQEAHGNPYLLRELVEHVQAGPEASGDGGSGGVSGVSLDLALATRLERLSRDALTLLELVSVSGRPLREEVVTTLLPEQNLATVLTELRRTNLVRGVGVGDNRAIEVYHDHVREAVLTRMDEDTVRDWHARLATALEGGGAMDLEALTAHLLGAREFKRAGIQAIRAAAQAKASLAFDKAAELYAIAVEHHEDEVWRHELQMQQADALICAGRAIHAADVLLQAAEGASYEEAVDLRRRAGVQLLLSGRWERGVAAAAPALANLGLAFPASDDDALEQASMLWRALNARGLEFEPRLETQIQPERLHRLDVMWSIVVGTLTVNPVACQVFAMHFLREALDVGEPARIVRGLCVRFMTTDLAYSALSGAKPQSLQRAETLVREVGDPYTRAWVDLARAFSYQTQGLLPPASMHMAQAEELFRNHCERATAEMRTTRLLQARMWVMLGRFDELAQCDEWIREANENEDLITATHLRLMIVPRALVMDDTARARKLLAAPPEELVPDRLGLTGLMQMMGRTQLALYEGDRARCRDLIATDTLANSPLLVIPLWRADRLTGVVRTELLASEDVEDPSEHLARAGQYLDAVEQLSLECYADHVRVLRAAIAYRLGEREQALSLLDEILSDADMGGDSRLIRACAELRKGQVLGGDAGRAAEARGVETLFEHGVKNAAHFVRLYAPGFEG